MNRNVKMPNDVHEVRHLDVMHYWPEAFVAVLADLDEQDDTLLGRFVVERSEGDEGGRLWRYFEDRDDERYFWDGRSWIPEGEDV